MGTLLAALSAFAQGEKGSGYFQIIYDTSTPVAPSFRQDLGYAVFIEYDGSKILMDTGTNPEILEQNLNAAGIDLRSVDMVVMTHNHFDHAGGLKRVREIHPRIKVLAPPGQEYPVGDIQRVEDRLRVTNNIYVIRGHTDVPTAGIRDDLSLVLRTTQGPYVLSSCSHSGVAQIVDRARQVTKQEVFYFSGGARLVFRPTGDTVKVAKALAARNVQVVSPSHCSLSHKVDRTLHREIGKRVSASRLGAKVALSLPQ